MNEHLKLPPGREPLRSDWFIEQLGASQQKVMGLTVANRALEKRLERIEDRADKLEELVMDVYMSGILDEETTRRVTKLLTELNEGVWGAD
jgi:hypothetical protein